MNQRFFGNPEHPLFGVYHAARGRSKSTRRGVLICPPIGQEFIRTHWCLRLLAGQLARKGISTLRMDYAGIGDSAGRIDDVQDLSIWYNNIRTGIEHLKKESGANTVMVVGLRFGATLAAEVARKSADVSSVVLWEPVQYGNQYLEQLQSMHSQMVDLWFCKVETVANQQHQEILGSLYSQSLLEQIESTELQPHRIQQPQLIIDLTSSPSQYSHPEPSLQKVTRVDDENSWSNLLQLETAWLRPQTTRLAVQTVDDMFNRLERFQSLPTVPAHTPSMVESVQ